MDGVGSLFLDLNRRLRQVLWPVLGASVLGYFVYHAVQGDRGLLTLTRLQNEISDARLVLEDVRAERTVMERRSTLLRPDSLDPDMLEERARIVLNHTHPDDVVVLLPLSRPPLPAPNGLELR